GSSSSLPSTTGHCRRHSRTRSTTSTASGTTRRPASSRTAATSQAPARSSICASSARACTCRSSKHSSTSPCKRTSKPSPPSPHRPSHHAPPPTVRRGDYFDEHAHPPANRLTAGTSKGCLDSLSTPWMVLLHLGLRRPSGTPSPSFAENRNRDLGPAA